MQRQEFLSKWIEIIKRSSATLVFKQNFVSAVLRAVRNCSSRHTYDTAWVRAVVEEVEGQSTGPDRGDIAIDLKSTARDMIGYYWDQTVFFNLRQGPNPIKQPRILREVKDLAREYRVDGRNSKPLSFREVCFNHRLRERLDQIVDTALEIVKGEVMARFRLKSQAGEEFIKYEKGDDILLLPQAAASAISENSLLIVEAVYYRWSQILEMYNTSPRINKKIRVIDTTNLRDRPLSFFTKYLDMENPGRLCFYCGQAMTGDVPPMDHVIPWSYLCSDDIWNLVYAHSGCRPEAYDRLLPEFFMARLEKRNRGLLESLATYAETDMVAGILQDAADRHLVRKNWMLCQE